MLDVSSPPGFAAAMLRYLALAVPLVLALPAQAAENRCGWFVNPSPANAWLTDAQDEWIVAVQGGHQAEGDWPEFRASQWIKTNGHYGHGCACMNVTTAQGRVTIIHSARALPLSKCRNDKALPAPY